MSCGLLLATLTAMAYVSIRRAWSVKGLKSLNLPDLAKNLKKFEEDVFVFLIGRQETQHAILSPDSFHLWQEWERRRDFDERTAALGSQRFAGRAIALIHLLNSLNIKIPNVMSFDRRLARFAAYLGAVANLLEEGLLEEARAMDPHQGRQMHLTLR